jgi:2-keto-4-pentenoate hydratase
MSIATQALPCGRVKTFLACSGVVMSEFVMPDAENLTAAAQLLASRRRQGVVAELLPEGLRPTSFAEAFTIQQQVAALMPSAIAGWKSLLPTADQQGDKLVVAPIYAADVTRDADETNLTEDVSQMASDSALSPATSAKTITECAVWPSVLPASKGLARVEPELAFVLAQDLAPRRGNQAYTNKEIDNAISHCHLALELIQSRYLPDSGAGYFDQLADGLFNQGLYLGPQLAPQLAQDKSALAAGIKSDSEPGIQVPEQSRFLLQIRLADGSLIEKNAVHPNENPKAGLYWLVNFLTAQGIGLKAGQAVITGSYAGVIDLPFGQNISFQYGNLGQFQLKFVEKQ